MKNQVFGQAQTITDSVTRETIFDGILGLGWPQHDGVLPVVNQMIAERLLDQNLFSVFFRRCKKIF